jgi:hypothetical protein
MTQLHDRARSLRTAARDHTRATWDRTKRLVTKLTTTLPGRHA